MTVECSHLDLESIPSGVDSGTQVLNMSSNKFPRLAGQLFVRAGLNNLQKIFLTHCTIARIDPHAFSGLLNLVELDLSHNSLVEVPVDMFQNTLGLMALSLRGNPISSLQPGSFKYLRQLSKLDLSQCRIQSIASGSFRGLVSLERLYLAGNKLTRLGVPQEFPPSLHGVTLHDNPWHCDCHLTQFRQWLSTSNVPRTIEPTCHSPDRLVGFRIEVLSLSEFACVPSVSPTSMYLSVDDQKNISIVCRVISDPASDISWHFNNKPVKERGARMRVVQQFEAVQGIRSELIISNTSLADNGTYTCLAENKAGRVMANYSLHVSSLSASPRIMELRLEQFVAVAISVIVILVLLVVIAALLLVRVCRTRLESTHPVIHKPSTMPRNIQMGTGQVANVNGITTLPKSHSLGSGVSNGAPDLLNGVGRSTLPSDSSGISVETTMTQGSGDSCKTAMSTIIRDYGPGTEPIIGKTVRNGNVRPIGKSRTLPCLSEERQQQSVWTTCPNPCQSGSQHHQELHDYPTDFGLPRMTAGLQEMNNVQNYVVDTPYLHTGGFFPMVVPRQKLVLPDEMYPEHQSLPVSKNLVPASLQYQEPSYVPMTSLTPSVQDPYYESIPTIYQPNIYSQLYDSRQMYDWLSNRQDPWNPRVPSAHSSLAEGQGRRLDSWNTNDFVRDTRTHNGILKNNKDELVATVPATKNVTSNSENKSINEPSHHMPDVRNMINKNDSSQDILEKLATPLVTASPCDIVESEAESVGIAEELENAFQNLDNIDSQRHSQENVDSEKKCYQDEGPDGTEI